MVDFAHEFMADFLAARYIVEAVREGRGKLIELIVAPAHGETEVFRGFIERELGARRVAARGVSDPPGLTPDSGVSAAEQLCQTRRV